MLRIAVFKLMLINYLYLMMLLMLILLFQLLLQSYLLNP